MAYLKQNWMRLSCIAVAAISAADVIAGVRAGKSLSNVTMLPSLTVLVGVACVAAFHWINNRTVQTKIARQGLDRDTMEHLENIFGVAGHQDVTPEMVADLAEMAAESVRRYADRCSAERNVSKVIVTVPKPQTPLVDLGELTSLLKERYDKSEKEVKS